MTTKKNNHNQITQKNSKNDLFLFFELLSSQPINKKIEFIEKFNWFDFTYDSAIIEENGFVSIEPLRINKLFLSHLIEFGNQELIDLALNTENVKKNIKKKIYYNNSFDSKEFWVILEIFLDSFLSSNFSLCQKLLLANDSVIYNNIFSDNNDKGYCRLMSKINLSAYSFQKKKEELLTFFNFLENNLNEKFFNTFKEKFYYEAIKNTNKELCDFCFENNFNIDLLKLIKDMLASNIGDESLLKNIIDKTITTKNQQKNIKKIKIYDDKQTFMNSCCEKIFQTFSQQLTYENSPTFVNNSSPSENFYQKFKFLFNKYFHNLFIYEQIYGHEKQFNLKINNSENFNIEIFKDTFKLFVDSIGYHDQKTIEFFNEKTVPNPSCQDSFANEIKILLESNHDNSLFLLTLRAQKFTELFTELIHNKRFSYPLNSILDSAPNFSPFFINNKELFDIFSFYLNENKNFDDILFEKHLNLFIDKIEFLLEIDKNTENNIGSFLRTVQNLFIDRILNENQKIIFNKLVLYRITSKKLIQKDEKESKISEKQKKLKFL